MKNMEMSKEEQVAVWQALMDMKRVLDQLEQRMDRLFRDRNKPCQCKQCEERRASNEN